MKKIINRILFVSKMFLFLFSFLMCFYLFLLMNNYDKFSVLSIILGFLPFFLVLLVFVFSWAFKKGVDNTIFNIVNLLAFIVILFVLIRTFFDKNMVYIVNKKINYYYFHHELPMIKTLLYLILLGNVLMLKRGDLKK